MAIRKSVATLSAAERVAFIRAVKLLKQSPSRFTPPTHSRYDDYVYMHLQAMQVIRILDRTRPVDNTNWAPVPHTHMPMWAHSCPAFLPWHRVFLYHFELDLQTVAGDPNLAIPYWDWTVNQDAAALPWTDDFLGGNGTGTGGAVQTGPFAGAANWTLHISCDDDGNPSVNYLVRGFGRAAGCGRLPHAAEVQVALNISEYDRKEWGQSAFPSFRNLLEGWYVSSSSGVQAGLHNLVHLWIGGTNGSMLYSTSPNEPAFFLHHANVDRLWAVWQSLHPAPYYLPAVGGIGMGAGQALVFYDPTLSTTPPWEGPPVTPEQVIHHRSLGYSYDTDGAHIVLDRVVIRKEDFVRATMPRQKMDRM